MDLQESRDAPEIILVRQRAGSMIVTSNRGPDEWLSTFADPMRAQAAIDRFTSDAYDLVIEGESYRSRIKPGQKAGQRTEKKSKWTSSRRCGPRGNAFLQRPGPIPLQTDNFGGGGDADWHLRQHGGLEDSRRTDERNPLAVNLETLGEDGPGKRIAEELRLFLEERERLQANLPVLVEQIHSARIRPGPASGVNRGEGASLLCMEPVPSARPPTPCLATPG